MPPLKRKCIGRSTIQAKMKRKQRKDEPPIKRKKRMDDQRTRQQSLRKSQYTSSSKNNAFSLFLKGFNYESDVNYNTHPNVLIGPMNHECVYCKALKYEKEPIGMCCSSGKVKLPKLIGPPEPLKSLTSGITTISRHFLRNIRQYNSCFQMTSFGATNIMRESGFMPTFRIQGQIYHLIGSLLPVENEESKFLQLYFLGNNENEATKRSTITNSTDYNIILKLQKFFHEHNHLIKLCKSALEIMPTDDYKIDIKADEIPSGIHKKRMNVPRFNETAVVMVGSNFEKRDIVLYKRNNKTLKVSELHRSYDALQYPIIFWQGEDGYHIDIMQTIQKKRNHKKSIYNYLIIEFY